MQTRKVWVNKVGRSQGGKTYQACFYDTAKKHRQVEKSFHSETLADEFVFKFKRHLNKLGPYPVLEVEAAATREATIDVRTPAAPPRSKLDWSEHADRWVRITSGTQNTFNEKTSKLRLFQKKYCVHFVEDVTEDLVSEFMATLRRQRKADSTIAGHQRILLAFLRWADHDVIRPETIERWKPYKVRERQNVHIYSEADYQAMLRVCDDLANRPLCGKLTPRQVEDILQRIDLGETNNSALAREYGVSEMLIRKIKKAGTAGSRRSERDGLWYKAMIGCLFQLGGPIG
jgi:hypothetical protein